MKTLVIAIILVLYINLFSQDTNAQQIRLKQKIDKDWLFIKGDFPDAKNADYDDKNWQHINLPHDFRISEKVDSSSISGTHQGFFPGAVAWYRKKLNLPLSETGKQVIIQFDGVSMNSDYWVNGKHVGNRSSGYISFWYNITPYLYFDRPNVISVRVDTYHQPFNRWYSGGGIYRHVWLNFLSEIHIPVWGSYISFKQVDGAKAFGTVETLIRNTSSVQKTVDLKTDIYNPDGELINSQISRITVENLKENNLKQFIEIEKPGLWSLETPRMYKAVSKIIENEKIIDEYHTSFGIRTIELNNRFGFLLNGKKVILKGVNLHQEAGCMGVAVPEKLLLNRLNTLKEIGCNAIRMSHYPHAPELLDMCDSLGFLVYDEFTDKWEHQYSGFKGIAAPFFETWKNDLKMFLDRDRNHPSIFIWSMGNEVAEQNQDPELGKKICEMMQNFTHVYEPTRKVTVARNTGEPNLFKTDVLSYNYATHRFAEWSKRDTNLIFISTETVPYSVSSQPFPRTDTVDYSKNSWFFNKENYAGQFIWAGFDYLGESKGWPERGCPVGLIATNGVRKPISYFTESIYSEKPMVYIGAYDPVEAERLNSIKHIHRLWYGPPVCMHWNFNSGSTELIPVYAFSNTDSVKLFLNDKYIGTSIPSANIDKVGRFYVKFMPGTLKAIGFKNGKAAATHQLQTAGPPAKITITSGDQIIIPDNDDVSIIRIRVTDKSGNLCPFAKNVIRFRVTGAGELAGVDNGDVSQHFNYKGNILPVLNGQCMAIIRSNGRSGEIIVDALSEGLEPGRIIVLAKY
jgi:beta-galactosidase